LTDEFGKGFRSIATVKGLIHFSNLAPLYDRPIKRPPAHPSEPSYPCYLSILGEFTKMTPHGESASILKLGMGSEFRPS
jgi:hypothetical protein